MNVVVNGKTREVPEGSTVADLIEALGTHGRRVVVELNGQPLDRSRFASVALTADDVVEVVRAVQGG